MLTSLTGKPHNLTDLVEDADDVSVETLNDKLVTLSFAEAPHDEVRDTIKAEDDVSVKTLKNVDQPRQFKQGVASIPQEHNLLAYYGKSRYMRLNIELEKHKNFKEVAIVIALLEKPGNEQALRENLVNVTSTSQIALLQSLKNPRYFTAILQLLKKKGNEEILNTNLYFLDRFGCTILANILRIRIKGYGEKNLKILFEFFKKDKSALLYNLSQVSKSGFNCMHFVINKFSYRDIQQFDQQLDYIYGEHSLEIKRNLLKNKSKIFDNTLKDPNIKSYLENILGKSEVERVLAARSIPVILESEAFAPEPVALEPVATEPVATEPVATEPVATEPVVTELVATELVATELVTTELVTTELVTTELVTTELVTTELVATELVVPESIALASILEASDLCEFYYELSLHKEVDPNLEAIQDKFARLCDNRTNIKKNHKLERNIQGRLNTEPHLIALLILSLKTVDKESIELSIIDKDNGYSLQIMSFILFLKFLKEMIISESLEQNMEKLKEINLLSKLVPCSSYGFSYAIHRECFHSEHIVSLFINDKCKTYRDNPPAEVMQGYLVLATFMVSALYAVRHKQIITRETSYELIKNMISLHSNIYNIELEIIRLSDILFGVNGKGLWHEFLDYELNLKAKGQYFRETVLPSANVENYKLLYNVIIKDVDYVDDREIDLLQGFGCEQLLAENLRYKDDEGNMLLLKAILLGNRFYISRIVDLLRKKGFEQISRESLENVNHYRQNCLSEAINSCNSFLLKEVDWLFDYTYRSESASIKQRLCKFIVISRKAYNKKELFEYAKKVSNNTCIVANPKNNWQNISELFLTLTQCNLENVEAIAKRLKLPISSKKLKENLVFVSKEGFNCLHVAANSGNYQILQVVDDLFIHVFGEERSKSEITKLAENLKGFNALAWSNPEIRQYITALRGSDYVQDQQDTQHDRVLPEPVIPLHVLSPKAFVNESVDIAEVVAIRESYTPKLETEMNSKAAEYVPSVKPKASVMSRKAPEFIPNRMMQAKVAKYIPRSPKYS